LSDPPKKPCQTPLLAHFCPAETVTHPRQTTGKIAAAGFTESTGQMIP
jgi:hypothetical protein